MTVYAPSDVAAIAVSPDQGGCGQQHGGGERAPGELLAVTCPQCEPVILSMRGHGWASDPMHVALTPDEQRAADATASKAQMEQQKTWSSPHAFAAFLQAAGFQAPGMADGGEAATAMLAQMQAMQAQINELRAERDAAVAHQAPAPVPAASEPAATPAAKKAAAKKAAPAAEKP